MFINKRASSVAFAVFLFFVGLGGAGCDPDWPGPNKLVIVRGKVTLDDVPLGNARVTFIPITSIEVSNDDLKPMAYAITDVQGNYLLRQADGTAGATTGQHTVIISKPVVDENDPGITDVVPDFYREHGYLKRHVLPLPGSHQMDFVLSTVDPLLKE